MKSLIFALIFGFLGFYIGLVVGVIISFLLHPAILLIALFISPDAFEFFVQDIPEFFAVIGMIAGGIIGLRMGS